MDKKILAGGAVLLGAAFWFYIKPHYLSSKAAPATPTEAQIAAGPVPTVFIGRTPGDKGKPPVDSGVVFNLKAPSSSPAYAKVVMALEFDDPQHLFLGLKGTALDAKDATFTAELQPQMYRVMDAITRVIGSKSPDDVSTTEGRDQLKGDLVTAINTQLHDQKVSGVYFVTFITQ
jgi:flagellar FliL protein